jgi:AMP phosphorylase
MTIQCAMTFGEQPLGRAIGPALEAREALSALMGQGPPDLLDKSTGLAGVLFEMVGLEDGQRRAEKILQSGKAEDKLREIIRVQGGDPQVKPENIVVGDKTSVVTANQSGKVLWISTECIVQIAREAGAPREKGAGVVLKVKLGDSVKKDDPLFEVFAERNTKLQSALDLSKQFQPYVLSRKAEEKMLLDQFPSKTVRDKTFVIER